MQESQLADHALTIHVSSARPHLRIDIQPPAIEQRNGGDVLTIGVFVTWESNDDTSDRENPMVAEDASDQLAPDPEWFPGRVPPLFRVPTRFRKWYLCEADGAEWSSEVDDPTVKDSCPICGAASGPIAVLGLPFDLRPMPKGKEFKLRLCRSLGTLYRN
jgi:hypothetical protein